MTLQQIQSRLEEIKFLRDQLDTEFLRLTDEASFVQQWEIARSEYMKIHNMIPVRSDKLDNYFKLSNECKKS